MSLSIRRAGGWRCRGGIIIDRRLACDDASAGIQGKLIENMGNAAVCVMALGGSARFYYAGGRYESIPRVLHEMSRRISHALLHSAREAADGNTQAHISISI